MTSAAELESALVDSVECATDHQSPEIGPIWKAVQAAIAGLHERDTEIERLRAACGLVVAAFDANETDFGHQDYEDGEECGVVVYERCPEDDTCECLGPAAINACAAALK